MAAVKVDRRATRTARSRPQADEQHFLGELARLLDPDRLYHKYGGFAQEDMAAELGRYYQALSSQEKRAFVQAALLWLWSGDELRQMQAIRLCGHLKLRNCVQDLLRLGQALRRRSRGHENLEWVLQALGSIGDERARPFLLQVAAEDEFRESALAALARLDGG